MSLAVAAFYYFLLFLGTISLLKSIYAFIPLILPRLKPSKISKILKSSLKNNSKTWAVVSGASEGIGKEFALELAAKGFSLVVLARSQDKLDLVKEECLTNGSEKAMAIAFDFGMASESDWEKLECTLKELEVAVLINNVGVSHHFPVSFLDEEPKRCEMITKVNIDSLMKLTRIVLPQMVARKQGLVLNIGSMLGKVPSSLLSVYSGSKAFVRHWSQCLAHEVKGSNIHVEHVNTLFVQTAMSKIRKPSYFIPTPRSFARKVLQRCGSGYDSTLYPAHELIDVIALFIPEFIKSHYSSVMHVDIRRRALRKAERISETKKNGGDRLKDQ